MTLFSVVWLAAALVISSLAGEQTTLLLQMPGSL